MTQSPGTEVGRLKTCVFRKLEEFFSDWVVRL